MDFITWFRYYSVPTVVGFLIVSGILLVASNMIRRPGGDIRARCGVFLVFLAVVTYNIYLVFA